MLLTTNLEHDPLVNQIGERTVSRLYEMCGQPLPMFGEDQRRGQDIVMPESEPAPQPRRWGDDDAFWEGADDAPGYGTQRAGASRRPLD